jgi:hypothetical protein
MPSQIDAVPWSTRAAALLEVSGELGSRALATRNPRRRSALLGLRCLSAFAAKQFELFGKGITTGAVELDGSFSPEFLLEATARQVGHDIDVLLRTVGQRDEGSSTGDMRATLDLADRLAASALVPAMRSKLIEETAVLTYFQKTPTIRLLPYVPLALIGIDLTAIHDTGRLLAVAHEAGHHVYRQTHLNYLLDGPADSLDGQVAQRAGAPSPIPPWLVWWTEEVFADVYSVLVGGPVAGLSIQAMLMGELPGVLLQDDADHPLPALRPHIAIAVLRKLGGSSGREDARLVQSADLLEAQWLAYLNECKIGDSFTPRGADASVSLAAARKELQHLVDSMLEGELAPLTGEAAGERWSRGMAGADLPLADLYSQFSDYCARLGSTIIPELTAPGGRQVSVTPQVAGVKGGRRTIGEIGDPVLDKLRDDALAGRHTLRGLEWKAVFLAADWVTEEGGSGIRPVT